MPTYTPSFTASVVTINPEECIGDSLSTINNNFSLLDYKLTNIATSADIYWNQLYNVTVANSGILNDLITTVHENSAIWDSAYTAITANSACWTKPITLIFPNVVNTGQTDMSNHISNVSSWLNSNFPITSYAGSAIVYNYCAGQKLFIFTMGYDAVNQKIIADSKQLKAVCTAKNLSWSWTSCSIRGRCFTHVNNIAIAGTDYDIAGDPTDDGGTSVSPGGNINFTLEASIANVESINKSIISYRPSLYDQNYLIYQNINNLWTYTSAKSLSS